MTEIKQGSFTLLECAERMLEASLADLMEKEAQTFKQSFKRTQSDQKSEIFNF